LLPGRNQACAQHEALVSQSEICLVDLEKVSTPVLYGAPRGVLDEAPVTTVRFDQIKSMVRAIRSTVRAIANRKRVAAVTALPKTARMRA